MKKQITRLILLFSIIIYCSGALFAQSGDEKSKLQAFAAEELQKAKLEKSTADSIANKLGIPTRRVFENGKIIELQRFENGTPIYNQTDNLVAANTISTSKLWSVGGNGMFNLSGTGQTLGIWDGGIPLTGHQEFTSRVTVKDGSSSVAEHATHVAGTMIAAGITPSAKGGSYNAKLNAYDWNSDLAELTTAALNGLRVSSHSYGNVTGWTYNYLGDSKWAWFGDSTISKTIDYKFGYYNSTAKSWDNFLYASPYILVCKSAGNDRGDDGPGAGVQYWYMGGGSQVLSTVPREVDGGALGYDCIGDGKSLAKNTLTVGAVMDLPTGYNGSVAMTSFSSWGPTDDGRIKPDVCGNGYELYSCDNTSTTAYVSMSGTSMATPNVSGSVGLLQELNSQLYGTNPIRAARLKGIILHTADEAGSAPGPDYIFGWGLMNTFKAAQLMNLNYDLGADSLVRDLTLTQGNTISYQVSSTGRNPLKATICWADYGGTPAAASLNNRTKMLVNDLDLRITGPNGTIYYPWVLDPANPSNAATKGDNNTDNVEQVYIENPVAGTYTITISQKGTLYNSKQDFSIAVTGNVTPLPVACTVVSPANDSANVAVASINFAWNKSSKALWYKLEIATDSAFMNIAVTKDSIFNLSTAVTTLAGLRTYYWRVSGVNYGGASAPSAIRKFTTAIAAPMVPTLVAPATGDKVNVNPKLSWTKDPIATSYYLQVATNSLMTTLVLKDSTITDTSKVVSVVTEGKKYYWRVSAKNTAGSSAFSPTGNFTVKLVKPDSLTVTFTNKKAVLKWADKSSIESGYVILKQINNSGYVKLDSLATGSVTYTDSVVYGGSNFAYKVFAAGSIINSDTTNAVSLDLTDVKDNSLSIPSEFTLYQNHPNPFNPTTTISFDLPESGYARLTIYNQIGEKVDELISKDMNAGHHSITWNASKLSSGVYFYELKSGNNFSVKKLILMK